MKTVGGSRRGSPYWNSYAVGAGPELWYRPHGNSVPASSLLLKNLWKMLHNSPSLIMSPTQPPSCAINPRTYSKSYGGLSESGFLHINNVRSFSRVDEEGVATSKRVEDFTKYKLPTYQAAAVVVRLAPLVRSTKS